MRRSQRQPGQTEEAAPNGIEPFRAKKLVYRRTDGITGSMSNPTYIEVRGGLVVDLL